MTHSAKKPAPVSAKPSAADAFLQALVHTDDVEVLFFRAKTQTYIFDYLVKKPALGSDENSARTMLRIEVDSHELNALDARLGVLIEHQVEWPRLAELGIPAALGRTLPHWRHPGLLLDENDKNERTYLVELSTLEPHLHWESGWLNIRGKGYITKVLKDGSTEIVTESLTVKWCVDLLTLEKLYPDLATHLPVLAAMDVSGSENVAMLNAMRAKETCNISLPVDGLTESGL